MAEGPASSARAEGAMDAEWRKASALQVVLSRGFLSFRECMRLRRVSRRVQRAALALAESLDVFGAQMAALQRSDSDLLFSAVAFDWLQGPRGEQQAGKPAAEGKGKGKGEGEGEAKDNGEGEAKGEGGGWEQRQEGVDIPRSLLLRFENALGMDPMARANVLADTLPLGHLNVHMPTMTTDQGIFATLRAHTRGWIVDAINRMHERHAGKAQIIFFVTGDPLPGDGEPEEEASGDAMTMLLRDKECRRWRLEVAAIGTDALINMAERSPFGREVLSQAQLSTWLQNQPYAPHLLWQEMIPEEVFAAPPPSRATARAAGVAAAGAKDGDGDDGHDDEQEEGTGPVGFTKTEMEFFASPPGYALLRSKWMRLQDLFSMDAAQRDCFMSILQRVATRGALQAGAGQRRQEAASANASAEDGDVVPTKSDEGPVNGNVAGDQAVQFETLAFWALAMAQCAEDVDDEEEQQEFDADDAPSSLLVALCRGVVTVEDVVTVNWGCGIWGLGDPFWQRTVDGIEEGLWTMETVATQEDPPGLFVRGLQPINADLVFSGVATFAELLDRAFSAGGAIITTEQRGGQARKPPADQCTPDNIRRIHVLDMLPLRAAAAFVQAMRDDVPGYRDLWQNSPPYSAVALLAADSIVARVRAAPELGSQVLDPAGWGAHTIPPAFVALLRALSDADDSSPDDCTADGPVRQYARVVATSFAGLGIDGRPPEFARAQLEQCWIALCSPRVLELMEGGQLQLRDALHNLRVAPLVDGSAEARDMLGKLGAMWMEEAMKANAEGAQKAADDAGGTLPAPWAVSPRLLSVLQRPRIMAGLEAGVFSLALLRALLDNQFARATDAQVAQLFDSLEEEAVQQAFAEQVVTSIVGPSYPMPVVLGGLSASGIQFCQGLKDGAYPLMTSTTACKTLATPGLVEALVQNKVSMRLICTPSPHSAALGLNMDARLFVTGKLTEEQYLAMPPAYLNRFVSLALDQEFATWEEFHAANFPPGIRLNEAFRNDAMVRIMHRARSAGVFDSRRLAQFDAGDSRGAAALSPATVAAIRTAEAHAAAAAEGVDLDTRCDLFVRFISLPLSRVLLSESVMEQLVCPHIFGFEDLEVIAAAVDFDRSALRKIEDRLFIWFQLSGIGLLRHHVPKQFAFETLLQFMNMSALRTVTSAQALRLCKLGMTAADLFQQAIPQKIILTVLSQHSDFEALVASQPAVWEALRDPALRDSGVVVTVRHVAAWLTVSKWPLRVLANVYRMRPRFFLEPADYSSFTFSSIFSGRTPVPGNVQFAHLLKFACFAEFLLWVERGADPHIIDGQVGGNTVASTATSSAQTGPAVPAAPAAQPPQPAQTMPQQQQQYHQHQQQQPKRQDAPAGTNKTARGDAKPQAAAHPVFAFGSSTQSGSAATASGGRSLFHIGAPASSSQDKPAQRIFRFGVSTPAPSSSSSSAESSSSTQPDSK